MEQQLKMRCLIRFIDNLRMKAFNHSKRLKEFVSTLPAYEETLKDITEKKNEQEMPPEYDDDDDEDIDYSQDEEHQVSKRFEELYIPNYDVVDKQLNKKEMTREKNEGYLIRKVVKLHLQLIRIRGQVTQYNKGNTNFAEKQ